jgi:integrase
LAAARAETEKQAAGDIETKSVRELVFNFAWWMKKQGYAESTIEGRTKIIKILAKRGVNLFDPESVKEGIANQEWSAGRKANAVDAYSGFLLMHGKTWDPPVYNKVKKLPFIPTETEIDQLIAGCGRKTATLLQLLKETAMRIGEAWNLHWADIDFVNNTVVVTPEKGSEPRIFKLSDTLIAMLKAIKGDTKSKRVFGKWLKSQRRLFYNFRRRVAGKLKNPRILSITYHTFRHWKATTLYHQTKDILYVMRVLGHKNIRNTLAYVQLEEAIFEKGSDDYISKAATTVEEVCKLVEAGFEYVCDVNEAKVFKKRK